MAAYWRHTLRYKGLFALAVFGMVAQQAAYVISPLYLRDFFNLISSSPAVSYAVAAAPLVVYALIQLLAWAAGRIEMACGLRMIMRVANNLIEEAFSFLMRHSYGFFTSSFAGALVQRVRRYKDSYERLYYSLETNLIPGVLYIFGITVVLLSRNLFMGLALFVWVVVFISAQWLFIRWQQPFRIKRAEEDSNVTAALADAISNQNTVALFAHNKEEEGILGGAVQQYSAALWRTWKGDLLLYGVQGILSIVINVGLMWMAFIFYRQGTLTIGDLLLVQVYVFGLFNHVWGIGREFRVIYSLLADAGEMVAILQTPHEVTDKPGAKALTVTGGTITFDRVEFYFQKTSPVLSRFNLAIPGGQKIAFVGPSGAGKSTITKLLLRLYDVPEGSISIDGQNIAAVTQDSLRDAISFVPQEPILFHRTLLENIRYGRRGASDEEVIEAARKAHCHEFIERLPLKYGTFVGERGIKLSGGERQRVAIARAILKDSPILVLDEATSSLDSESEMLIQDALATLMQNKTVLVIAHRLSTIMKMDRIVVLEGGAVVADGTHEELLKQEGLYHKLWSIQAGGFIGAPDEPDTGEPADNAEATAELAPADEEK